MKKIAVLSFALLFLFGCSSSFVPSAKTVSEAYNSDFSADVTALADDFDAKIKVSKNGKSISFVVIYPEDIAGMSIALFDEHALISYEGMEQKIKKENLPEKAVFLLLEDFFEDMSDPEEIVLTAEGDKLLVTSDDFFGELDKENFSPKEITFPQYNAKFLFSA